MKSLMWSIILGLMILVLTFVSVYTENTADLMFALLGGSVVGVAYSLAGTLRVNSEFGLKIFMYTVISAGISWFIFYFITRVMTLSLYSTTAMIFDLIAGILGATTAGSISICVEKKTCKSTKIESICDPMKI